MNFINPFISMFGDIAPIIATIFVFQLLILKQKIPNIKRVLFGLLMVWIGLTFFMLGLEKALFPLGRLMAEQLTSLDFLGKDELFWFDYYWMYIFAACIGFATTIAEPSLLAVAIKANQVSGGSVKPWPLRIAVALGVAIGIYLALNRIHP